MQSKIGGKENEFLAMTICKMGGRIACLGSRNN
jgi:hypothetical protein